MLFGLLPRFKFGNGPGFGRVEHLLRTTYTLLHYLAVPFLLLRLLWRGLRHPGYWRDWRERFGFARPLVHSRRCIWVHGVSVGEVQAAVPVVHALRASYPSTPVVVTTTTPTGRERVRDAFGSQVHCCYLPFDLPGAVARFLRGVEPRFGIIMETELWPNLLHACADASIPIMLANVRLSQRSADGYARVANLVREMLANVSQIAAQTQADAERLIHLGANPEIVRVTGSVKFDVSLPASIGEVAQAIRRSWGVDRGVWIAASTHEGEEVQVLDAFSMVLEVLPDCLLVLVPRHPHRFQEAIAVCRKRGYDCALRSERRDSHENIQVFVGDSMGELPQFYAAADIAFVGGSLVAVGGHNMLEPAALGIPVIVGPELFNFSEISERLGEAGGARVVHDAAQLSSAVVELLSDANLRHWMGEQGRRFVASNRGAIEQLLAQIELL